VDIETMGRCCMACSTGAIIQSSHWSRLIN